MASEQAVYAGLRERINILRFPLLLGRHHRRTNYSLLGATAGQLRSWVTGGTVFPTLTSCLAPRVTRTEVGDRISPL
jgi:hypothetical protein